MNDQSLFIVQLLDFVKRHGISDDMRSRLKKLREEVEELADAIDDGDLTEVAKEAADVAIIAFHIMVIVGVSPLWLMHKKLQEVAERPHYQEKARQIAETTNNGGCHDRAATEI